MTEYALLAAAFAATLYLFIEGAPKVLGSYFRPFAIILTLPIP